MSDLEALRRAMTAAETAWMAAKSAYERALTDAFQFKVGDEIQSATGERAKVASVFVEYGRVKYVAVLAKADGTFGKRHASLWSSEWRAPTIVSRDATQVAA